MIFLIAALLLVWVLIQDERLFICYCTMWRSNRNHQGHWKYWRWNPTHGPQSWPWWRLVSVRAVYMDGRYSVPEKKKVGIRIWFYTRWVDQHVDILVHATRR